MEESSTKGGSLAAAQDEAVNLKKFEEQKAARV